MARPQFAIAVLLEYGGSGGHAAGPIANQILHALRLEGYL
jgi:cell division protein FtsI/penicillin-binding protein 2